MVKRWVVLGNAEAQEDDDGRWVLYSDYQDLREALKEALEGWDAWLQWEDKMVTDWCEKDANRIDQLRSLYLRGEKEEEFSKQVQYVDGVAVGIQYGPKNK